MAGTVMVTHATKQTRKIWELAIEMRLQRKRWRAGKLKILPSLVYINFAKLPLGSDILLSNLCSSVEVVVCSQTALCELRHSRPSCETQWNLWHLQPYMVSIGSCTYKTGVADVIALSRVNTFVWVFRDWCNVWHNIFIEFTFMIWENEMYGLVNSSPGTDLLPVSFNHFGRLSISNMKFKVANVFNCPVVCDSRILLWYWENIYLNYSS